MEKPKNFKGGQKTSPEQKVIQQPARGERIKGWGKSHCERLPHLTRGKTLEKIIMRGRRRVAHGAGRAAQSENKKGEKWPDILGGRVSGRTRGERREGEEKQADPPYRLPPAC